MCGFGGEIAASPSRPDAQALERLSTVLAPRGPDGQGRWDHGPIGLVHRRLKVIDLSDTGAQPMVDDERGLAIVFNGCIYNYRELRSELQAAGETFRSASDTEVILAAFGHWGPERFVQHLIGMFAFALVETRPGGRVFLVRDRLGIKPLYLAEVGDRLRFASSLPALLAAGGVDRRLDRTALHHYLSFHSVVPAPRTILRGVRKLPPASVLTIEADGRRHQRRYWEASFARDPARAQLSAADWQEALLEALRVAVRRRMVADVPVGVLLSGGFDSSLIVALLAEAGQTDLSTFSIGFEDAPGRAGNEFAASDLVARRFATDHERIDVPDGAVVDALTGAVSAMSEPMVSHDAVAFYLLAAQVSRRLNVVQSGQGADEVLAGYSWYPPLAEAPGSGADDYAREMIDFAHADLADELEAPHRLEDDVSARFVRDSFARPGADEPVDRALRLDTEVMLVEDPVKRLDNMTMASGLEARTPFLDHELVELAAACPPAYKLARGGKGVLKDAARHLLPAAVIDRPKGYFPVPLLSHLGGPALALVRDALTDPAARARGVFAPDGVERLLAAPNERLTTLGGNRLWQLGLLELWLQDHGAG
jgi:asparagine synthase (glutamine-hydrolysing)